ncbi:hypothetical protein CC99x_007490 [Candidatus Berkiella cookevillensis]|uniref:Uncharacterized protein n=1 Tax=Candidatus Berkiella cookevillensis TaxID=437022 RepID=A0A0Q9Y9G1_9GAMM|nr:hypothetical protein [Candidatus Berkiella cookevillensis]MCS5708745.1 hypothetical protein [Candidatus Berkiella cookevillensis]
MHNLKVERFRNIINLSENYFSQSENEKEMSSHLWLAETDLEKVLKLLDEKSGLPKGNSILLELDSTTSKDIIQSVKYYFRNLVFFDNGNLLLQNFIDGIRQNKTKDLKQKSMHYQACMQTLITELIKRDDKLRAYCLHEILHLIYKSLTPEERDAYEVAPIVTSTIAPMFQEAFGYKENHELIVPMFEAFAFIVRDAAYRNTFHLMYPDVDPSLELLTLVTSEERNEVNAPIDPTTEQSAMRKIMENPEQEQAKKEEKISEPAKAEVASKLDMCMQSIMKKLQGIWSALKPKLIQGWNYAYPKTKAFVLWLLPKIKEFLVKCWKLLCSGLKETYKMIVKKKESGS